MTEERLAQITHPGPLEAELIAEVRRLREALRFYANDQYWHTTIAVADGTYRGRELPAPLSGEMTIPGGEIITVTAIAQDLGKRARQALEEEG